MSVLQSFLRDISTKRNDQVNKTKERYSAVLGEETACNKINFRGSVELVGNRRQNTALKVKFSFCYNRRRTEMKFHYARSSDFRTQVVSLLGLHPIFITFL